MKTFIKIISIVIIFSSCEQKEENKFIQPDLNNRKVQIKELDNLNKGKTYLPLYSHIYHIHEKRILNLAVTVSMRNISLTDSIYIMKADYYNTSGDKIREYIQDPIYLKPLETIEFIIRDSDNEGGSGANFIFDWAVFNEKNPPLFEAVMISTYGQQGISFTTKGVNLLD